MFQANRLKRGLKETLRITREAQHELRDIQTLATLSGTLTSEDQRRIAQLTAILADNEDTMLSIVGTARNRPSLFWKNEDGKKLARLLHLNATAARNLERQSRPLLDANLDDMFALLEGIDKRRTSFVSGSKRLRQVTPRAR